MYRPLQWPSGRWGLLPGGVPARGCASWGVYLLGGVPARGVYLPRGVYLLRGGVPAWGCTYPGRVYLPSGVGLSAPGGVSQHALGQTPPPVNRITDACENITFPQLLLRTVTNPNYILYLPDLTGLLIAKTRIGKLPP